VDDRLFVLDLLLKTGPLDLIWEDREIVEINDTEIKLVSMDGLMAMKKEANREQDKLDIQKLLELRNE
jgi:hypothetical protein